MGEDLITLGTDELVAPIALRYKQYPLWKDKRILSICTVQKIGYCVVPRAQSFKLEQNGYCEDSKTVSW